jgi:phospho-N-acetylmuramoyl-pentapeptide-transferase
MGPVFIPFLEKLKFGQIIREEGPKRHQIKQGTPTMGGIMFILAITASVVVGQMMNAPYYLPVLGLLLFGAIGFADDYIKVVLKRNLGLRAYQKLGLQIFCAMIFAVISYPYGHVVLLPFIGYSWDMGALYYPFTLIFMAAITNSVNLTDGLDGLSSGVSLIASIFFAFIAYRTLDGNLMTLSLIFIFALMGFLYFNKYPAKVFMGDTGSLAIGGFIGGMALITHTPFHLIIVGGVFVMETLSVVIQVTSFKLTGKRVFKMSPLHHHFELSGWSEKKIVRIFWLTGVLLLMMGMVIY